MTTFVSFPPAPAKKTVNRKVYTRFQDVQETDYGTIRFKLPGSANTFTAWAESTEGGRWVLLLQYVHRGGTNPVLRDIIPYNNLPAHSSAALGTDESAIPARWGNISAAYLGLFPDATANLELRFYGRTSAHARIIHFKTDRIIDRWRDNVGNMIGVNSSYTLLSGHNANLPRSTSAGFNQQNVTNFPYYTGGLYHWACRGLGTRWEVDDYPNNSANHTIHRVWCRYRETPIGPLVKFADFNSVGNWVLAGNVVIVGGRAVYSGGNTVINGIVSQVVQTQNGSMYRLTYNVGVNPGAPNIARLLVEVRNAADNALITSLLSPATAAYTMNFTAPGPVNIRFIDQTNNTVSTDCTLDNVTLTPEVS